MHSPNDTIGLVEALNTASNNCLDMNEINLNKSLSCHQPNKNKNENVTKNKPQENVPQKLLPGILHSLKMITSPGDIDNHHKIKLPDANISDPTEVRLNVLYKNHSDIFQAHSSYH